MPTHRNPLPPRVYRRRRIAVAVVLALFLSSTAYALYAIAAPLPPTQAAITNLPPLSQPAVPLKWPTFGSSAIGAIGFPDVLASNGPQNPVPIASITKVITALVVLNTHPLTADQTGPSIQFNDADVRNYQHEVAEGGSVTPVTSGMVLTQRETLQAMLIPSANNYSTSLATWAYGSVETYLHAANTWLHNNGFNETTVMDPSGLSPANTSTPTELIKIGKLALEHPVIAAIVATPSTTLPTIGTITNSNTLIGQHGIDGIKTGTTDEAGACLLFSADFTIGSQNITIVGVLLGAGTHSELDNAVSALVDSVQPAFRELQLTTPGTPYANYTTPWGQTTQLIAAENKSTIVWQNTPATITTHANPLSTAKQGDELGTITFSIGTKIINVPLHLSKNIDSPGMEWRITHLGPLFR